MKILGTYLKPNKNNLSKFEGDKSLSWKARGRPFPVWGLLATVLCVRRGDGGHRAVSRRSWSRLLRAWWVGNLRRTPNKPRSWQIRAVQGFFLSPFSLLLLELCGCPQKDWRPRRKGRKNQLTVLKIKQNSTKSLSSSETIPMESTKWAYLELPDCKTTPLLWKGSSFFTHPI